MIDIELRFSSHAASCHAQDSHRLFYPFPESRSIFDRPPEPGDTVRGVTIDTNSSNAEPQLIFFARTCISQFGGNSCVEGVSNSRNVTVCKTYCTEDGCNAGRDVQGSMVALLLSVLMLNFA